MTTKQNDGGPAFPCVISDDPADRELSGMSLRDYFAGQAIAGCACNLRTAVCEDAKNAYKIADAMLLARESK